MRESLAWLASPDWSFPDCGSPAARIDDFRAFLDESFDEGAAYTALRRTETTGRPIGGRDFLESLKAKTGRTILPRKPGPNPHLYLWIG